jgi:hypothetical protein
VLGFAQQAFPAYDSPVISKRIGGTMLGEQVSIVPIPEK